MEAQLRYRLITGKDDANFCQRISKLLDAQAVILKDVEKD
ncbi:MAG: DUF1737 domain-containing protein [Desulfobacteraceae bacterium]|nr:DUF1737 domain-containing protein [Desulfobacteraceae bacterium]